MVIFESDFDLGDQVKLKNSDVEAMVIAISFQLNGAVEYQIQWYHDNTVTECWASTRQLDYNTIRENINER